MHLPPTRALHATSANGRVERCRIFRPTLITSAICLPPSTTHFRLRLPLPTSNLILLTSYCSLPSPTASCSSPTGRFRPARLPLAERAPPVAVDFSPRSAQHRPRRGATPATCNAPRHRRFLLLTVHYRRLLSGPAHRYIRGEIRLSKWLVRTHRRENESHAAGERSAREIAVTIRLLTHLYGFRMPSSADLTVVQRPAVNRLAIAFIEYSGC